MIVTPTELQLIGGGAVLLTALGSYWFFKRRSDRAAANINKTEQHSDQFDKIMQTLEEDNGNKRQGGDRRKNPEQRRVQQRPMPGSSHEPARSRDAAIREAMTRDAAKPRVSPEQSSANRLRDQQEEELRRRRRQNDEDANLLTTLAVIQATDSDPAPASKNYASGGFTGNGGSFGGGGASSSWGGDCGSSSSSSSDSSSSSSDSGSCSSSD